MSKATPQEVRDIFGNNLKNLIQTRGSVSQVCRDIGVNRTQFARYLAHEAHPRPDVLLRICTHFGVDARILTQPLDELRNADRRMPRPELNFPAFLDRLQSFDHGLMPDGYYRLVRPAFTVRDTASAALVVMTTLADQSKRVVSSIDSVHFGDQDQRLTWPSRRTTALAFQQAIGTAFLFTSNARRQAQALTYFTHGHDAAGTLFFGFMAMMRSNESLHAQVLPAILERYGDKIADGVRARRRCGVFPYSQLRNSEQHYFEGWNPFGPFAGRWLTSPLRDIYLSVGQSEDMV